MTEGIFALGGVALGVGLNWLVGLSSRREAKRERRRTELLDLISNFLADSDTRWAGAKEALYTLESVAAESRQPGENDQELADWIREHNAVLGRTYEAERRAELALVKFRIIAPELVPPAWALLDASREYTAREHKAQEQRRGAAVNVFVHSAQALTRD